MKKFWAIFAIVLTIGLFAFFAVFFILRNNSMSMSQAQTLMNDIDTAFSSGVSSDNVSINSVVSPTITNKYQTVIDDDVINENYNGMKNNIICDVKVVKFALNNKLSQNQFYFIDYSKLDSSYFVKEIWFEYKISGNDIIINSICAQDDKSCFMSYARFSYTNIKNEEWDCVKYLTYVPESVELPSGYSYAITSSYTEVQTFDATGKSEKINEIENIRFNPKFLKTNTSSFDKNSDDLDVLYVDIRTKKGIILSIEDFDEKSECISVLNTAVVNANSVEKIINVKNLTNAQKVN